MKILRTPDSCFENLADYDFSPHYMMVDDGEGGELRVHYLDEGPKDADPILLLHGEPSWCYLYRKVIPILTAAGHRVIAPDLLVLAAQINLPPVRIIPTSAMSTGCNPYLIS